jgi:hypothetical protein
MNHNSFIEGAIPWFAPLQRFHRYDWPSNDEKAGRIGSAGAGDRCGSPRFAIATWFHDATEVEQATLQVDRKEQ